MKKIPFNQFKDSLALSQRADQIISEASSFDKLVKFSLGRCETTDDFENLYLHLINANESLFSFIHTYICNEHTENIEDSTDSSTDN